MWTPYHRAIEAHWRDHRPKMVQALEAKGELRQAVDRAADRTAAAESAAMQNGTPAHEAIEMFREQWAFLPSEEDEPNLTNDPTQVAEETVLPRRRRGASSHRWFHN